MMLAELESVCSAYGGAPTFRLMIMFRRLNQ